MILVSSSDLLSHTHITAHSNRHAVAVKEEVSPVTREIPTQEMSYTHSTYLQDHNRTICDMCVAQCTHKHCLTGHRQEGNGTWPLTTACISKMVLFKKTSTYDNLGYAL